MNITAEQVVIIGFVAILVAQAIKLGSAYLGLNLNREVITVGLFVIAVVLAGFWAAPALPAFPNIDADPAVFGGAVVGWIGNIVAVASVIIGFATLIYNLLLNKVFEALGWTKDKVIGAK